MVPPGGEVVTLVEAAAPEQRRLTVRVESTGGTVAAHLQHSTLAGLVPLGIDHVVPGAAPARGLAVGFTSSGEAVDDDLAPQVRLLAPGAEAGTATLTVYGADGRVRVRGGELVELAPGVVTDQSLGGLPAGAYTVVVDATVPVVAAAVESREGDPAEELLSEDAQVDRAWIAATALGAPEDDEEPASSGPSGATRDRGTVALVPGTSNVVRVGAVPVERSEEVDPAGSFRGVLRAYGTDGALLGEREIDVPAGSTIVVAARTVGDGKEPAVLTLDATDEAEGPGQDGPVPVWSVVASAGPALSGARDGAPGTLVSVLLPVPPAASQGTVEVRATRTAGLPR